MIMHSRAIEHHHMKHCIEASDIANATRRVSHGSVILRSHLHHPVAFNNPRWLSLLVILDARNHTELVVLAKLAQHTHHVASSHVHRHTRSCSVCAIGLCVCRSRYAKYSASDCKSRNDCCCKGSF